MKRKERIKLAFDILTRGEDAVFDWFDANFPPKQEPIEYDGWFRDSEGQHYERPICRDRRLERQLVSGEIPFASWQYGQNWARCAQQERD